jgi:hypothetical protein
MTNPTSNFGWQMPTASDLVTDLPADFETFGQAVDTSLADLKGGTTGQILSKASNTDMDFTWVANDVGDITAVTAGTGITGGGTSGAVTVSFDQANFGGGQFAAGKNKIINGDFNINQRAFTSTIFQEFTFDRFATFNSGGTSTYTAEVFALGTAPVAGYESKNFIRIVSTGQSAAGDSTRLSTPIESVRTLAGQTATLSFWAKAATGTPSVAAYFQQFFGTGGSPSASINVDGQKTAITTSWARYSFTFNIPSISGKTLGTNNNDILRMFIATSAGSDFNARTNSLGIQSATIDIWGVQLEAGSIATPFQTATGTIQGELAACQRYYYRSVYQVTARQGAGFIDTTTTAILAIPFPVSMRTRPTALEQSGTASDYTIAVAGSNVVCTSVPTHLSSFTEAATIILTASLLVAGQGALFRPANTNAYLGWSAEL